MASQPIRNTDASNLSAGLTAATKLEDWIDYAIRSDYAPYSLAQFDNLAQKTRLSKLVVQRSRREFDAGPSQASISIRNRLIPSVNCRTLNLIKENNRFLLCLFLMLASWCARTGL